MNCERCGRPVGCCDGTTRLSLAISRTIQIDHWRRLCRTCFDAVAQFMTTPTGPYRPDDDSLGGASVLTEGGPA